jgi:photosystem II stability/assembly factor-like uncharacterized protein
MKVFQSIPDSARRSLAALAIALPAALSLGFEASAEQWLRRSPGADPYVRNVAVFSNNPVAGQAVVYAATLTNGVVRIVDNGSTLTPSFRNNGLPMLRVRNVSGPDVNNLFVALDGAGVYKTTDGGANWVSANGSGGTALGCMNARNVAVRSLTEIWVATSCRHSSGIYRSLDGGATWSRLGTSTIPDDDFGSTFAFFGTGPTTVVVYASLRNGAFRSADNGATWAQINNGLPTAGGANRLSVYGVSFFAASTDMIAYVEGAGVYRTINSGANWSASGTGLPSPVYSFAGVIKESNTVLYIGTDKGPVYRSTDGGSTWSAWGNTGTSTIAYVRNVARDITAPTGTAVGKYWLTSITGLYRTTDNGVSISQVPLGGEGYVTSMVLDPNGVTGYFATDTLYKIPDVYVWDPNAGADIGTGLPGTTLGGYVVQDKTQPATLYASLNYQGLWKTVNGGTNWTQLALPNVQAAVNPFVEISPSNPQVLYGAPSNPYLTASGGGFFVSTNGGTSWTETSTGLSTPAARDINGIALSEATPLVIVIATEDGLYRSADGGANWAPVLQVSDPDGPGSFLPMGSVRFDPVNPQLVYASGIHVRADGTVLASSGVYKSANGGVNWTQVLSGKRVLAVRPENSGRVVVMLNRDSSQPAMLSTIDGGTTWQPFTNGITYNDGIAISRTVSEQGSRVVLSSMTDGIYVLAKAAPGSGLFRAYLSQAGNDANPCTLPAPCRLLPAALAAVKDGGEIWMLNSANFNVGVVDINKSVTILAVPGALGSVVANNADAMRISGSSSIEVTLRNLVVLNFNGAGNTGIRFNQGAQLTVESCEIYGLGTGIIAEAPAGLLAVKDTTVRDSASTGVALQGTVFASLDRVALVNNASTGLMAQGGAQAVVSGGTISGSATGAIASASGGATARLTLSETTLPGNGTAVAASAALGGDTAQVVLDSVAITHNGTGVTLSGAGTKTVFTRQNNALKFNGTDVTGGTLTVQGGL